MTSADERLMRCNEIYRNDYRYNYVTRAIGALISLSAFAYVIYNHRSHLRNMILALLIAWILLCFIELAITPIEIMMAENFPEIA